jgi:hypothetical protein
MCDELFPKRFLYAGYFDEFDGGVLLRRVGLIYRLPGGEVKKSDIVGKDETYRRKFIAKTTKRQTGITYFVKNDESIPIETGIQPTPAVYSVNRNDCEHSVVIVGDVDYNGYPGKAAFYHYWEFMDSVQAGRISVEQELLILRIFASRDYPNRCESRRAGESLRELQKEFQSKIKK